MPLLITTITLQSDPAPGKIDPKIRDQAGGLGTLGALRHGRRQDVRRLFEKADCNGDGVIVPGIEIRSV